MKLYEVTFGVRLYLGVRLFMCSIQHFCPHYIWLSCYVLDRLQVNQDMDIVSGISFAFLAEIEVPKDCRWIKANVNMTGFYRVHYDDNNWKALSDQLEHKHEVSRLCFDCMTKLL